MPRSINLSAVIVLALAAAACGKTPADKAPAVAAADGPAKPAAFGQCAACHSVEPGANGIGPSLAGVVGRKAGSLPGFVYSAAMKADGKVWDEATLDAFLTSPAKAIPGTKMTFAGQGDPAKRKAVIDYLKTLK